MQLTVALAAEEGAGVRALQLLADRGHRVAGVFTRSDGRGVTNLAGRARSLGVPVRSAVDVQEPATADWLRATGVQLLLNVHSLHIVDANVLAAPALGAYNLHPGPLPERAGLHAPSWALYEGAVQHGVTLHRMTPEVDAGAIVSAEHFELHDGDTALTVMLQCVRRGINLIERLLDVAEGGGAIPQQPQDLTGWRWYGAGPPNGGRLDWRRPARDVINFVRACDYRPFHSPWGFPRCTAGDVDLAIMDADATARNATAVAGTVAEAENAAVLVAAGDRWVRVEQVDVRGRALAAAEALTPGLRLE